MDVTAFSVIFCLLFVALGILVLCTYWQYYQTYKKLDKQEQLSAWAIWYHPVLFQIWAVSTIFSTIGFVAFSIWVPVNASKMVEHDVTVFLFAYGFFLVFSGVYAPFLETTHSKPPKDVELKKFFIMLDLILVSICLIVLFVWIQEHVGWSPAGNACLTTGMLILTIHCTVLDCILWGFFWCRDMIYDSGKQEFITKSVSAAMPTPLTPWPTISRADICALTRPPPPHLRPPA
jgi:hypothetical protein